MRGKVLALVAAGAVASTAAMAGVNPGSPGLPSVTRAGLWGGTAVTNNHMSAMCVDCHTLIPKAGGTHFASQVASATRSGGAGVSNTGAVATRDASEYFKLSAWTIGTYTVGSKYGDSVTNRVSKTTTRTPLGAATVEVAGATYDPYEIICESCHNIIYNAQGGNNLLAMNTSGANINYTDIDSTTLCVGCHGYMYTTAAANSTAPANASYAAAVNTKDYGALRRGNNEFHWIKGTAYAQNHHVMTGDNIDGIRAAAGLLWTDNLIIAYTDQPISNVSTKGTYPVSVAWDAAFPRSGTAANFSCTNCHAPGHGAHLASGASILRGTVASGNAATAIERIGEGSRAFKKINDGVWCGSCHAR